MSLKKIVIVLCAVIVIVVGAVYYIYTTKEKPCATCENNSKNQKPADIKFSEYLIYEPDLCNVLTTEIVSNLLDKPLIKTVSITSATMQGCKYYLTDVHAITINHDKLNVERQKAGHESLDRKIITNPKITMEHFLVAQENGLINEIYLVLGENEYVSINRTSAKTISEEEMIKFAVSLSEIVSDLVPLSISNNSN